MGNWITLQTAAGPVAAWQAKPAGPARAGLVVIQEIFGVNAHIRAVADGYAAAGYAVLAPAFFDPVEKDVELGYGPEGYARGRELVGQLGFDTALGIVAATRDALAPELPPHGKIGSVGYCWGGTLAMLAAQRLGLPSVSYYGGRNTQFLQQPFKAPVMFHFGEKDSSIPPEAVQQHREQLPQMQVFTYAAGHAFNRDVDPKDYEPASAALALQRTLAFFEEHLR